MPSTTSQAELATVFEAAVRRFDGPSPLTAQVHHHLGFTGEGDRPSLFLLRAVLMAAEECGADDAAGLDAATAAETLFQSLCVHDDVAAEAATRDGRATIWERDGLAHAINAGDALSAVADLQLVDAPRRPAERTIRMSRLLQDAKLRWCAGDRSALVGSACALGALAAGAEPAVVDAYARLGRTFGAAVQTSSDVSETGIDHTGRLRALLREAPAALR